MTSIDIIQEVQQNFIDSSYDVNTNRAFPDARDGLKPGQRAILWEMWTKGYKSNKPHVKSAKIDGGVAALWWPHGTTAIYETFARMSQPFTNNVPEIDFHGANGNIILGGDAIAADRYTEARLAKIVEEGMLKGVDKNNVEMIWNFSEDEQWPKVLPAVFPRLLVNGAQGIGVSVANVFLPHNFTETGNLILDYLRTGELNQDGYYPDFPTGGTIINQDDLDKINRTGKGKVIVRGKYKISGQEIIFYEMPYQVYIEPVIEKIKEQIEKEELTGIKAVYNKSDKKRIALSIECERGAKPEQVVEQLFAQTPLQSQYNANQNGIVSKTPILLNLQQLVDVYVEHNTSCISKEHEHEFGAAISRIEILEGLTIALESIDEIVALIRNSKSGKDAQQELMSKYNLSERQSKAILDMKLARLSNLESVEVYNELQQKKEYAEECKEIMESAEKQKEILAQRLQELVNKYGDKRRTEVTQLEIVKTTKVGKVKAEPVIEDVVVLLNNDGYFKSIPVKNYRETKGLTIGQFKTNTAQFINLFSNQGRMFRVKVSQIPICGPVDKGTAVGSFLTLNKKENIIFISPQENNQYDYMLFSTKNGMVKKCAASEFLGTTQNLKGAKATGLKTSDEIVSISLGTDIQNVMMVTNDGYCVRFSVDDVNYQGRLGSGVKGITLREGDFVVSTLVCNEDDPFAVIGRNGNCKLVDQKEFTLQGRGGKGAKVSGEPIAGVVQVKTNSEIKLITSKGVISLKASNIKMMHRSSYGDVLCKQEVLDVRL